MAAFSLVFVEATLATNVVKAGSGVGD
eukprot:SAG11_NODE_9828_length_878_cov_0.993582_2_plen_26_part_01